MPKLSRSHYVAAVITAAGLSVALLSGCTSTPAPTPSDGTASTSTTTSPVADPSATSTTGAPQTNPSKLDPSWMPGEKVIASFASQHTGTTVGPYSTSTGFIAVYIRCVGKGKIDVTIPGSAGYSLECSPNDADQGIRNTSQIQNPKNFTVQVQSTNIWSIAITEIEQPKIDSSATPSS